MQNGGHISQEAQADNATCAFCQRSDIATSHILKATSNFLLVADHAPLVEGHLLIIPKVHYACYGAIPAELDEEFYALKREVQHFFTQYYAPVIFWEHGIFRQTVFHAHLHCFPFETTGYDPTEQTHSLIVRSQDDLRQWYKRYGQYFYMEDASAALIFAPEMERYIHIIRDVLWKRVMERRGAKDWVSAQQRYAEGVPLIAAMLDRWQKFQQLQQLGVDNHADETSW